MTPLSDLPAGDLHTVLMGRVPHPEFLELATAALFKPSSAWRSP
ncbi:hypothetical protein AB0901_25355 [Streptomyces roseifaciens]